MAQNETQSLQAQAPLPPIARGGLGFAPNRNLTVVPVDNGFVVSYNSSIGPVSLVATGEQELHEIVSKWYQSLIEEG